MFLGSIEGDMEWMYISLLTTNDPYQSHMFDLSDILYVNVSKDKDKDIISTLKKGSREVPIILLKRASNNVKENGIPQKGNSSFWP